jgi:hypothetical protein
MNHSKGVSGATATGADLPLTLMDRLLMREPFSKKWGFETAAIFGESRFV